VDPKAFDLLSVPLTGGLTRLGELWGLTVSGWTDGYPWVLHLDMTNQDYRGPTVEWLVSQGYPDAGESDEALLSALRACQASMPIEIPDPPITTLP